MIYIANECCDCATENYPCTGSLCPLTKIKHYVCDKCGDELLSGELYYFDGEELCINCIVEELEVVE